MKKMMLILSCTLILSCLVMVNFGGAQSKVTEIRIGMPLSITGAGAYAAQTLLQGVEMAIDEINAAGGIKSLGGAKLRVIKADTKTDAKTGGIVTEALITRDKVHVIWGEYTTGVTLVMQDVCEKYGVPNLAVAGSPIITERGLKWAFRTHPHIRDWNEVAFDLLKQLGVKTAVIFSDTSAYGKAIRAEHDAFTKKHGIKVLLDEVYERGTLDLSALIYKMQAARPDAVLGGPYLSDAILMLRQMKETNVTFPLLLGLAAGFTDIEFWKKTGGAGEYVMAGFAYHDSIPTPENQKFVRAFKEKHGVLPDNHHEWGYADVYVIADALERAKSIEPEAIHKALEDTDMVVPIGRVKFGPDRQNREVKGIVIQWLNGKMEIIWPKKLATTKVVYPMPMWDKR